MLHLGDLPNVGYATQREKELSDAIMQTIRSLERNRLLLLDIILAGRERWHTVAKAAFGLRIDSDALDAIWFYLALMAVSPAMQRRMLDAQKAPDICRLLIAEALPNLEAQREQVRLVMKWKP